MLLQHRNAVCQADVTPMTCRHCNLEMGANCLLSSLCRPLAGDCEIGIRNEDVRISVLVRRLTSAARSLLGIAPAAQLLCKLKPPN
jgi:hypothetical protein